MTLYQAKGLEFPIVFVPSLLDGEWPTREGWGGAVPARAAARGDPARRRPHGGGAAAALRRDDARAGAADAADARRADRDEEAVALRQRGHLPERRGGLPMVDRTAGAVVVRRRGARRAAARRRRRPGRGVRATGRGRPGTSPMVPRRWVPRPRWSAGSCRCRPRASVGSSCGCGRASWSGCSRRPTTAWPDGASRARAVRGGPGGDRPRGLDGGGRGPRRRAGSADLPIRRRGHRRRGEPAPGGAAAVDVQLLVARHVGPLRAHVRVQARLPDPRAAGPGAAAELRLDGARGVRDVHARAPRAGRARRGAADAGGAGADLPGRLGSRRSSATASPRRATSGASRPCSTTSGTARSRPSARR